MRKTQLYIIAIVLLCALSVGAISRPVNSDAGLPHAAHADSTAIDSDTTTRTDSPSDSVSAGARRIIDLIGDTSEPEAADTVVSVETHDTATATGPVLTAPRLPVDSAGLMPDTIAMPDSLMTDSLAEAPRSVLQIGRAHV